MSVQQVHLDATDDELIVAAANQLGRIIYTCDDDFVRINSTGIPHLGILYHHALKYSIGDAIRAVALACQVLSSGEMRNRVEFL